MKVRAAVAVLALFALSTSVAAAAKIKLLSIGEVVTSQPRARGKLGLVRTSLEQELETIDWRKSTRNKPYVVSVSIVNLQTETTRDKVATTCELSTTVRLAKNGSVVAILNQRARAENEPVYAKSVEDGAIRAAASAAIRKIPSALERAKKGG
jgi:hypothetical protein